MDKIDAINLAISEYFDNHSTENEVPAKDLMKWFIRKGIFPKDNRKGLPIRRILRNLHKKNELGRIPSARAEQKTTNVGWYFMRLPNVQAKPLRTPTVSPSSRKVKSARRPSDKQSGSDEEYVIDLCDEVLGVKSSRQHRFDFLLGDPSPSGRRVRLPVDAYYEKLALVIEYRERQHEEEIRHFDKPEVMTVSGVHRGEQRRLYDQRRREVLPKHGIKLIEISFTDFEHDGRKRIVRNHDRDFQIITEVLKRNGVTND